DAARVAVERQVPAQVRVEVGAFEDHAGALHLDLGKIARGGGPGVDAGRVVRRVRDLVAGLAFFRAAAIVRPFNCVSIWLRQLSPGLSQGEEGGSAMERTITCRRGATVRRWGICWLLGLAAALPAAAQSVPPLQSPAPNQG